jgi:hypothetical protein
VSRGRIDVAVRFPDEKKKLKAELRRVARSNGLSVNRLMIFAIESFLKKGAIDVKIGGPTP